VGDVLIWDNCALQHLAAINRNMRDDGVFLNERGVCSFSTPMGDVGIDKFLTYFKMGANYCAAYHNKK
jgi:hypothetical protein